MTIELQMLFYTSLLSVALAFPPLLAVIQAGGPSYAGGNRDEAIEMPAWGRPVPKVGRSERRTIPKD